MTSTGPPPSETHSSWATKQMAALNAANQVRLASRSSSGNMSVQSEFGGISTQTLDQYPNNLQDGPRPPQPNQSQIIQGRQRSFLGSLGALMVQRGTPLPPQLTGVPYPAGFDASKSLFNVLDVSPTDFGTIRLTGKDVDLFKLWTLVFQSGGMAKLSANNRAGWNAILPHFDLPEHVPNKSGASTPVAAMLAQYYNHILAPFEDAFRKNMANQQQKQAVMKQQQQGPPQQQVGTTLALPPGPNPIRQGSPVGPSHAVNPTPPNPLLNAHPNSSTSNASRLDQPSQSSSEPVDSNGRTSPGSEREGENLGTKRKFEEEATNGKRSRLMSVDGQDSQQKKKVEYVPYAREVDTYGGRDFHQLDAELLSLPQRRPWRDHNDWGHIDIDILTMFLRSRISKEISYALTTITLLSTMRGQAPGTGFPITQCPDMFHEMLDLLEDEAFGEEEDKDSPLDEGPITTQPDLVNTIHDIEDEAFASLQDRQGGRGPSLGPVPRPGQTILVVINIIRNLAVLKDNVEFMGRHERLLSVLLRLCSSERLSTSPYLRPSSPILSLSDLVVIRKDILYIISCIASHIFFCPSHDVYTPPAPDTLRTVRRLYRLVTSYLVDKWEALPPVFCIRATGATSTGKPPLLADMALEILSRTSAPDVNRQVLSQVVPSDSLRTLFEALVHRLPVTDYDFTLINNEYWLSYLEKDIFALYSLAFIASPELKRELKADRVLGFQKVMLRMTSKFILATSEARSWFASCARRSIETMKLVDDAMNAFDSAKSQALPTLSFGMGFGDTGGESNEKGTGLLGGHRSVGWDMMMNVGGEDTLFAELDSLCRVECPT